CWLKRLITVKVENPVPLTVIMPPASVTDATVIPMPIGTETALLFLLNFPSLPALLTTNEPGPVNGALGPLAGKVKLSSVGLSPALPGLRKNGPTLPPGQAQNRSTATPLVT